MSMVPTRDQPPRMAAATIRRTGAGGPAGAGVTPRDIWRILLKRIWLILVTFLVTFGVVTTGTVLWRLYAPSYTATALLEVKPPKEVIERTSALYTTPKEVIDRYRKTAAQQARVQPVLMGALKDEDVVKTAWYNDRRFKDQAKIIQDLDDVLTVGVPPETTMVTIGVTIYDAREAMILANAVAKSVEESAGAATQRERQDQLNKLEKERLSLRGQLDRIRKDISSARSGSSLAGFGQEGGTVSITLRDLTLERNRADLDLADAVAQLEAHKKEIREGTIKDNPDVLRGLDMDPMVRGLSAQVAEFQNRLTDLMERLGPNHRTVLTYKSQIDTARQQLETRRVEIMDIAVRGLTQKRMSDEAVARGKVAEIEMKLEGVRAQAKDLEEMMGKIVAYEGEQTDVVRNLGMVEQRSLDIRLLLQSTENRQPLSTSLVTLASLATVPRSPSSPLFTVMLPLGVVLALLLSLGLAFALEFSDSSVKTPSDISRRVGLPLLGMVPHADDLDEEIADFRRVAVEAPGSLAAESFRQIRTNLLYSGPANERRSLLVTSPTPGDGRTTVVMNLAASMAQAGRRVLVVDANFRQPAIAKMFPDAAPAGLSSVLVGQAAWRDVVSPTGTANLSVIAAGPLPPNPSDLLGSDAMRNLINETTAEYDQVLLDGAPAMIVSDALVLATQVDGVILVVRAGVNSIGVVQRSVEQLHRVGARVLGVVLQGVRTTSGGYLRKNYETFYEYHQQAKA